MLLLEFPLFEIAPQRIVSDDVDASNHGLDLIPRIDWDKGSATSVNTLLALTNQRQRAIECRARSSGSPQLACHPRRGPIGNGLYGQRRIEPSVVHVDAPVYNIDIVQVVNAAIAVHHGCFGIVSHAACAGLVLPSANTRAGYESPGEFRACCLQPLLAFFGDESSYFQVVRMTAPTNPQARNTPMILQIRHKFDAALKHRHFLYGTHDASGSFVMLPHELLVLNAPTRNLRRNKPPREIVRQPDKLIRNHRAAL